MDGDGDGGMRVSRWVRWEVIKKLENRREEVPKFCPYAAASKNRSTYKVTTVTPPPSNHPLPQLPRHLTLANFIDPNFIDPNALNRTGAGAYAGGAIDASLSWSDIAWFKSITRLPILIKGVFRSDDARLAVEHGVDGIIVSNHGGRQLDGCPATVS
ncbi:FMN-dependent dehydrogenase-domain-containing protein [Jimgerdemannia flammicorona]|uniref:FMN-dependent dehydrogenase-domain-containing protein n=1 Tax=Jimgerdemannia flammicorona TaxID=994334 RepID=A0A433QNP0_9FUNG|nr:FMN-dependent dehydrogenase-domain-containing protein [Jimgerdemannia flammicorona]